MTTQNLYNANDGISGRDGGPYLDQEMALTAEVRRAKVEAREPDLINPTIGSGSLQTADQLLANISVSNLPSQAGTGKYSAEVALQALVDQDGSLLKRNSVISEDEPVVEAAPVAEEASTFTFDK